MKTTIDIADSLLESAKGIAARDGVTLRTLVEQGLRHVLDSRQSSTPPFTLRKASFKGTGLQSGEPPLDWDRIREKAYGIGPP